MRLTTYCGIELKLETQCVIRHRQQKTQKMSLLSSRNHPLDRSWDQAVLMGPLGSLTAYSASRAALLPRTLGVVGEGVRAVTTSSS